MKKLLTTLLFTFFAVFNICYADDYDHNFHPMQVTDSNVENFVEKFNSVVTDEFFLITPPDYQADENDYFYVSKNNKFIILFTTNDMNCIKTMACGITSSFDASKNADFEQYLLFNDTILTTLGLTKLELQRMHQNAHEVAWTWCNKTNRLIIRAYSEDKTSGPLFFYSASENEPLLE